MKKEVDKMERKFNYFWPDKFSGHLGIRRSQYMEPYKHTGHLVDT